jgi:DNA-binding SARP family transcriptional activator
MAKLRVFGNIDYDGDGRDDLLKQPKRLALLVYLVIARPRGFHRRDKLLGIFWPELDTEHARASLRKAVYVLRGLLGEDVILSRGDEDLGVNPEQVWSDVVAFEEALQRGHLAKALELYRGDLLKGFFIPASPEFDQWVDAERQRLRELAAKAAWELAEQFGTGDQLTVATTWVRTAMRLSMDDERKVRKGLRMLAQAGDKSGALKMYNEFLAWLANEHGTDIQPSEETQELMRDIREGRFPPKDGNDGGAGVGARV